MEINWLNLLIHLLMKIRNIEQMNDEQKRPIRRAINPMIV